VVAVDNDIVPEGGRGPAMMWAGFRMGIVAETVHEYIRAGSKGLGDVLVPVLARVTISHQAHRVVVHHKCVTAAAGDDRNRVQALAIGYRDEFRSAVKCHAGVTEVLRDYVSRPAVLGAVELHRCPSMVFVGRIAELTGFAV